MSTEKDRIPGKDLTYSVIGAAMEVHNVLGYGFLEKVYERALLIELKKLQISVEPQKSIPVSYKGESVGDYIADILVDESLILELKSTKDIEDAHRAQTINYLKATGLRLALLINFGKEKLQYQRLIY